MAQILVPDISRYQGNVDFNAVKGAVQGIVIKATGADDGLYVDSKFVAYRDQTRQVGLPRWFYHFKGGAAGATAQANYFLNAVGGLLPGEQLVLDDENEVSINIGFINEFASVVRQKTGKEIIVYSNQARITSNPGLPLWVANYGSNNGLPGTKPNVPGMIMWQYTSKGQIPGINGYVDLNIFFGDVNQFKGVNNNMPSHVGDVEIDQMSWVYFGYGSPSNSQFTKDNLGRESNEFERFMFAHPVAQAYRKQVAEWRAQAQAGGGNFEPVTEQLYKKKG